MMSNSEDKANNNDIFSMSLSAEELNNKRAAIRYIRTDISLTICVLGLFSLSRYIPVKLLDISSKGAAIKCKKSIPLKKKIALNLLFDDNSSFTIPAKIIHGKAKTGIYGVQFDQFNNELGDFLLSSPDKIVFK